MRHILNENNIIEIAKMRISSFKTLRTFESIIKNGAKTDEEIMIGYSYYYLALVDGVYRNSLRECYMWENLSHIEQVNTSDIWQKSVSDIKQYFDKNNFFLHYFEGWDRHVRNAVGHSTFHYDRIKNKMIYEDKIGKNNIIELNKIELIDKVQKLFSVFELVLLINQIRLVNDVCDTFLKRYSKP